MTTPASRSLARRSSASAPSFALGVLLAACAVAPSLGAQDAPQPATGAQDTPPAATGAPEEPRGLRIATPAAFQGYTLLAPLNSHAIHLVDMQGNVVHTWETAFAPGAATYLLDDGHLLRCGMQEQNPRFHGGGIGGRIQELAWDGALLWDYELANAERTAHHDIHRMPNGHVLLIAWEHHSREEALERGRDPAFTLEDGIWSDIVLEIEPVRPAGGNVVWTWRTWDHLVQDRDAHKPGWGRPAAHPGRLDINFDAHAEEPETAEERAERLQREEEMAALGYVGGSAPPKPADGTAAGGAPPGQGGAPTGPGGPRLEADWLHTNGIDYQPEQDLIVLSTPHASELWVIDHGTTSEQAAGSTGGRRGRGGELLWRWGNPATWGRGTAADQKLFYQHNPTWLPGAAPGELRLLVFNNGGKRPDGDHSTVEELVLPFDPARGFVRDADAAFGPAAPAWLYQDRPRFLSTFISGAQRLPNGNTLVCEGKTGRVFEVQTDGTIVWEFLNPLGGEIEPSTQGGKAPPRALFRAQRVPLDHPGLADKSLATRISAVELQAQRLAAQQAAPQPSQDDAQQPPQHDAQQPAQHDAQHDAQQPAAPAPVIVGEGAHRYAWQAGAFAPPAGTEWGNTHGEIVVDSAGLLHISFDTPPCIRTFRADGTQLSAFGDDLGGGVHGMTLAPDAAAGGEALYFVHFARHEWFKTTLDGQPLLRRGAPMESGRYESADQFAPTSIAVAPDGTIFVADGYGRNWIHVYDSQGAWRSCFGGPGHEVGQLDCAHGVWVDTRGAARGETPTLLVADRENHRIQRFGLDGTPLGVIASAPDLRRPCKLQQRGEFLVVPDLAGRVTILDGANRAVAQLGDNPDESLRAENGVPREKWVDGRFLAPHSAAWDADGNLYVMDWNRWGRLTALRHVPPESP
jgi:hypothetical protein